MFLCTSVCAVVVCLNVCFWAILYAPAEGPKLSSSAELGCEHAKLWPVGRLCLDQSHLAGK